MYITNIKIRRFEIIIIKKMNNKILYIWYIWVIITLLFLVKNDKNTLIKDYYLKILNKKSVIL